MERIRRFEARTSIRPSARTQNSLLPFRPESSNPTKIIDNRDWDLFVVDMPRVNAFVLPTKEIFVYSGLLDLLEKEEPLIAAVIAHEISKSSFLFVSALMSDVAGSVHVSERHAVENMGFLALSSVIFDILRGITFAVTISFPFVTDTLGTLFNMMNGVVAERAYSRKLESEADTLGLMLMAKAGYNPESALELWGLLNMLENDARDNHSILLERVLPFLRTHPQGEARLDNIRDHLPEAMRIYGESQKPTKAQQIVASLVNVPDKDEITEIANVQKDPHLFP